MEGPTARVLTLLLVPVRCQRTAVTPDPPPAAPVHPLILHGCRAHAAPATCLGHPCSKPSTRMVPEGRKRFLRLHASSTAGFGWGRRSEAEVKRTLTVAAARLPAG